MELLKITLIALLFFGISFGFVFWIAKRFSNKTWLHRIGFVVISMAFLYFLFGCFVVLLWETNGFEFRKAFQTKTWLADPDKRYLMLDDLIASERLIGKDTTQVKEILGPPSADASRKDWHFEAGGCGFTFYFLDLSFSENKVVEAKQGYWTD